MKKYFSFLLAIGLVVLMLNFTSASTFAQTGEEPTPTPEPASGDLTTLTETDPNTFTLRELGFSERFMVGPYDIIDVYFSVPDYWQLNSNTSITVNYNYTIGGAGVSDVLKNAEWIGGTLIVRFNDDIIATELLTDFDDQSFTITFRPESLIPKGDDDTRHHLRFYLDASMNCYIDDLQTTLWIDPKSAVTFSYYDVQPELNLAEYPKPYYQPDSIVPAELVIAVPNDPTAVELQAGYTVAAGLGAASGGESIIDFATVGEITEEQLSNENMIFVGNRFPELGLLEFPISVVDGNYLLAADKEDNGVIQTVQSPWSDTNVIMLVGGNSDEALMKAAKALSTGSLVTSGLPNVALISNVNTVEYSEEAVVDRSFGDMGFQSSGIGIYGDVYYELKFNATAEQAISQGAYLEFISTRSDLLDFDRSGLMLLLNDEIIGTVGYTGDEQAVTTEKIEILPNFIRRGENRLEIVSSLVPHDTCYQTDFEAAWVTVSDTSNVHLPVSERTVEIGDRVDLDSYPTMLLRDQQLSDLAIVIPEGNANAMLNGAVLAFYLGNQGTISLSNLEVYYANDIPQDVLENNDLIFVGKATDFSILTDINNELPASFEAGSNVPNEPDMPVNFNVLQDVPVGYVQLLESPWNESKIMVLATGNIDVGIELAVNALTQDIYLEDISGNFVKIVDTQVSAVDTRLLTGSISVSSQSDAGNADAAGGDEDMGGDADQADSDTPAVNVDAAARPDWLQPTIIGVTVLMVIILVVALLKNRIFNVSDNGD